LRDPEGRLHEFLWALLTSAEFRFKSLAVPMNPNFNYRAGCCEPDHRLHRRLFSRAGRRQRRFAPELEPGFSLCLLLRNKPGAPRNIAFCFGSAALPANSKRGTQNRTVLYGGPFKAFAPKIPGVHISELMPKCARILDQIALVRSMKTKPSEHFQASTRSLAEMDLDAIYSPGSRSVLAQQLGHLDSPIPISSCSITGSG